MKENELERARRETDILRQLKHPHIAQLFQVIETDNALNIVMEYAGKGIYNIEIDLHIITVNVYIYIYWFLSR